MINIGNTELSAIYYGSREISAVYKGSTLIWQKQVPVPSSEIVYAMLSGTGAYAQYNGLWEVVDSQFGPALKKEDAALTGDLSYSYVYFTKVWPGAMSYSQEATAFLSKSVSNRQNCIAYSYECGTSLPITLSAQSGVYDGFNVVPSTVYWYNGDSYNLTSGGTPGVLISSHLWDLPFDEKYRTLTVLDYIEGAVPHLGMSDDVMFYAGNMIWTNAASSVILKPGGWQNGGWVEDRTIGWGIIASYTNSTAVLAAISGSYAWPWCAGNNRWRVFSFTSTPRYGKVCFIPIEDSFIGIEASGAGVAAINGVYVPSGTYNGIRCFQKRDGESILAYNDGVWEFYADRSQLGGLGYYYYDDTTLLGTYGYRSIDYSPSPTVRFYLEEYEQGGGGGGVGTVIFTCGGGSGSVTLNGVTKNTNGGGQQLTFEDLPEGEYPVTYGNMGSGPASVTVVAGETTSVTCNFPCFVAGTKITLADGSEKNVEDITYQDELLTWNFDKGEYASSKPIWILQEGEAPIYMLSIYEDGKELKTVGPTGMHHEIYNADENTFDYTDNMVGKKTFTIDGIKQCISTKLVKEPVKYYNIITAKHFNLFANGILTSCRLNNLYPIKNMQYVKNGERNFKHPSLEKLDKDFLDGLRVSELDESYENYILALTTNKLQ